jgi:hypothetical protein
LRVQALIDRRLYPAPPRATVFFPEAGLNS